jgi:hypothetical protein
MISTCGYATQLSRQFLFHTRQTHPIIEEAGTPAASLMHLPALLGIMIGMMERTLELWNDGSRERSIDGSMERWNDDTVCYLFYKCW